jgi:hypothetical protein
MDYLNRRVGAMLNERSSWVPHWKQLNAQFSPRRGKFLYSDTNKGSKRNNLINNTPLFAKRTLVSGLMTGITSPARPWFRYVPPDPGMADFGPVREWLDAAERLSYRIFAAGNLYKVLPTVYEEACVFGQGVMIQEKDYNDVLRYTPFTVGEYMLDIDDKLKVDTFGREFQLTTLQTVQRYGIESVSHTVKNNYDNGNYSAWVPIRHIIERVGLSNFPALNVNKRFKYVSVTWEPGTDGLTKEKDKFLRVKGFHEFPILAPRWDAKAGDTYGFCPAMDALGDARALQVQEREKGKAVAKVVAPPTTAPASLKNTNVSLLPGSNNFTDDPNNVFRAIYQIDPRINELRVDIKDTEERINRAFFVDLFLLISQQDDIRTATEIAARQEEKLLQLGPVLEGMFDELLDPTLGNQFSEIVRLSEPGWRGDGPMLLPPPPQELQGVELKVEYISLLAQAQKIVATGAMERWVNFGGQLASVKPEALDKINTDNVMDTMAEDLGVPAKAVNNDQEIQKVREARKAQEQQQMAQDQAAQGIDTAKTLSEIPTNGDDALSQLMSGAGISSAVQ